MKIKSELQNLQTNDIYSLILFALYKVTDNPQHAALSQLAYILDKDNLLKLCEFFGGMTLKIPTIDELEVLVYGLLVYQQVDIEKRNYDEVIEELSKKHIDVNSAIKQHKTVREILHNYDFNSGRN